MSASGLAVFDRSIQTANVWLDEVMADHGPDRQRAWHILTAVLHALRDRLPVDLAAHLGAQLPLIVRGAYYDQFEPSIMPDRSRSADEFIAKVSEGLSGTRPVDAVDAVKSVFDVLSHYLDPGQIQKVQHALPEDVRRLWTGATVQ